MARQNPQQPSAAPAALLAKVPLFAGLAPGILAGIAAHCRLKLISARQVVFAEGDPCTSLCILEEGRVKFFRVNPGGREQILKVFETPGDTFCLASAFGGGRHIVSARAAAKSRLYLLDLETVHRLVAENPSIGRKLMQTAGEHMTHLVELADDLALKSATGRLAKHLHQLAAAGGELRLSRARLAEEDLASRLGMVRVHVSRSLASLARAGAIDLEREFIRVRDLALLKRIAEGK